MPKPRAVFSYDYETVAELSDWPQNRLHQDQTRGDIDMANIASVAIWLAANGKPWVRAALAAKLVPDLLGTTSRGAGVNDLLQAQAAPELLKIVFQQSAKPRKALGKKRGAKS